MTKVFDCCMFFNELDMIDLRFHILADVIDYFVVIESLMTHSGQPKARIFGDALEAGRFVEFEEKIIYSCAPTLEGGHSWDRERYHRGLISGVLEYMALPKDWVIVGDVDEIPTPDAVQAMVIQQDIPAAIFECDFFYYDFAHKVNQGWGIGGCKWSLEHDANKIRRCEFGDIRTLRMHHAAIHLSYFMTPEQVVAKLDAFMHHGDVAKDVPRDPVWIGDRMRAGLDLFGRTVEISEVDPEPCLPEYVKAHREQYAALGWLKPEQVTT